MNKETLTYSTNRLLVCEWHSISSEDRNQESLEDIVIQILTPRVTASLPPAWQGGYSRERAKGWIQERDEEGITLLVVEQSTRAAIGLVILLGRPDGNDYRLGYLLVESAWGKGFAGELVGGFVDWCRNHGVSSITGGVGKDNIASIRVLEKNGFIRASGPNESEEFMYELRFGPNGRG